MKERTMYCKKCGSYKTHWLTSTIEIDTSEGGYKVLDHEWSCVECHQGPVLVSVDEYIASHAVYESILE